MGAAARLSGFVPRANDARQPIGLAGQLIGAPVIVVLERVVVPHGRGRRPQQEPQVAPVDRQVLELQDRAVREQAVEIFGLEPD